MLHKLAYVFLLSSVMVACSSRPTGPSTPPPETVANIVAWDISGRIGIRTQDDALSGNFNWHKDPASYDLNISGPFGQGATSLVKNSEDVIALSYDNKTVVGESAKQLLQEELGWEFPVEQVAYWVRGLPSPNSPAIIIPTDDNTSNTLQIDQDGWLIEYKNHMTVESLELPQKIQISKPPYKVNLIINHWTIQ